MLKKMTLLAMVVGALIALAAPAMAQAVQLTEEGAPLKVGAEVTATSTDLQTTTGIGTLECELVTIHGEVTENGPESVHIEEEATTTAGCNVPITAASSGPITLNNDHTGVAPEASFTANVGVPCTLSGSIGFTFATETDVLTIPGSVLTGPCFPGEMHGSFTLETEDGTPVTISE